MCTLRVLGVSFFPLVELFLDPQSLHTLTVRPPCNQVRDHGAVAPTVRMSSAFRRIQLSTIPTRGERTRSRPVRTSREGSETSDYTLIICIYIFLLWLAREVGERRRRRSVFGSGARKFSVGRYHDAVSSLARVSSPHAAPLGTHRLRPIHNSPQSGIVVASAADAPIEPSASVLRRHSTVDNLYR